MLIKRIITAVILIPLVVASAFLLPIGVLDLLILSVVLLAAWEFSALFNWRQLKRVMFLIILGSIALFIESMLLFYTPDGEKWQNICSLIGSALFRCILFSGGLWWLIAPYFLWRYVRTGENSLPIHPMIVGMLIFIPCWASLFFVLLTASPLLFCFLLSIVWAADIGAYFIGKFFGRHFLMPKISPKKTIEGVYGGVLASLLVAFIFVFFTSSGEELVTNMDKIISLLILTIIVSLWSVIGDLFESMLKRQANVKDSGKLLPGHGGIYDRIDGLTAGAPIFVIGYSLIELLV